MIKGWVSRYISSEESILLLVVIAVTFLSIVFFGSILGPLFASIVIAFLLQGVVNKFR